MPALLVILLSTALLSALLSVILVRPLGGHPILSVLVAAFAATGLLSVFIFRMVHRFEVGLAGIRSVAARFAEGDFNFSPRLSLNHEFPEVSETLEQMAEGLKEKVQVLTRQRNEQKAIFLGMIEAVIVLDANLEIIEVNPAAARLMGVSVKQAKGRSLIDLIRNPEFHTFARETLGRGETRETSIRLSGPPPRYLQAYGTFIRRRPVQDGLNLGDTEERLVLVLHDITKLKNLERIRKDFVANVSHELKTPITSIKGFIETLKEGDTDPQTTSRFLGIIGKQTERMEAIIEDLLSLSRLEQIEGRPLITDRFALRPVLDTAVELVTDQAAKKGIEIHITSDNEVMLDGNPSLVEQAVLNLVDNAVKYSSPGHRVFVEASSEEESVKIIVRDEGIGIPAKELPRIFERFYRVDRARSRELGGTGLGLAIVKHIALAHRGEVLVESTPGVGSVFTLKLPGASEHYPLS